MKRVAIIGGGISGLSAAFYLQQAKQAGAQIDFTLFEAGEKFGGSIGTEDINGCLVESGADSFLSSKPWAARLAIDLGLQDQLIYSNDFQRKTWIVHQNRLVALPDGMQMAVPTKAWPIISSPLLSVATKMRMAKEYFSPPSPLSAGEDESVASFFGRHFGGEVVARVADPLLAGIYGGSAETLSARATLPQLIAREKRHRSLVRGALREKPARNNIPIFTTFRKGMQQLVDAVVRSLPQPSLCKRRPITAIRREGNDWQIDAASFSEPFSHVICSVPAFSAAALIRVMDDELSRELVAINFADSITIAVGYSAKQLAGMSLPRGFGFLVPREENRQMIACTFVHRKFYFRVPENTLLFRAFFLTGLSRSDSALQEIVQRELAEILGIHAEPDFFRIHRWPRAMPQYEVGHLERTARIEERLKELPGLQLIGNSYRGIGIPDCVREGKLAAEVVLRQD